MTRARSGSPRARPRPRLGLFVPVLLGIGAILIGRRTAGTIGHAIVHPAFRAWLDAAYWGLRTSVAASFAFFTIGRAAPKQPARSPVAFIACGVAMAPFTLEGPSSHTASGLVLGGDLVAVAACVWLLGSVLFLGRCFGVLPEARGLVTRGPYSVVRHPVYLGEIGATLGLAIAAPTLRNALALGVLIAAQTARMSLEERALSSAFPEYEAYVRDTPRLVPLRWLRLRERRVPAHPARSRGQNLPTPLRGQFETNR